ncbi:MAG: polyprenyl synthetase family protein [Legionellaceae bacterium]|nr:polyprenyl synthetase family protein [Legionellaceae bacterium]
MPIHRLKALVSDDFEAMNDVIVSMIQAQIGLIDDLANHIIQSGGKRLRPLIVLLASRACNYLGRQHITLAAMIEFFHTATLLHDDVVDDSTLRRGKETANSIWGSKASILVGDYFFTLYLQLMLQVGDMNIMHLLADITHQITCGEIKQLSNRHNYDLAIQDYFDVIRSKTSLLFAASSTMGALISQSSKTIEHGLYAYGLHLGNAFQLIDDALDYCSDAKTIGKNIGDDLAEGKATMPLLYVLQHGTSEQKHIIRQSLETSNIDDLPTILSIIAETDAINYTRQIAAAEVEQAIAALDVLPESIYKNALKEIASYAVTRDH